MNTLIRIDRSDNNLNLLGRMGKTIVETVRFLEETLEPNTGKVEIYFASSYVGFEYTGVPEEGITLITKLQALGFK